MTLEFSNYLDSNTVKEIKDAVKPYISTLWNVWALHNPFK